MRPVGRRAQCPKPGQLLAELVKKKNPGRKIIVFTQFADTVHYLRQGTRKSGSAADRGGHRRFGRSGEAWPGALARRATDKRDELRPARSCDVLVCHRRALSEGQNLQDCAIVVNYDLPWAIIRLIQRAGRVDRIGQGPNEILCYTSCRPTASNGSSACVLASVQRLQENAEVVGTDEAFFEDDRNDRCRDLFTEKAGLLDGDADDRGRSGLLRLPDLEERHRRRSRLERSFADLPSRQSTRREPMHPRLAEQPELPPKALRASCRSTSAPADGSDDRWPGSHRRQPRHRVAIRHPEGGGVRPAEPALARAAKHHELVARAVELIAAEEDECRRAARSTFRSALSDLRTAEALRGTSSGTLFDTPEFLRAIEDIYNYPLRANAANTLNAPAPSGISDESLAESVIELREEGRLCMSTTKRKRTSRGSSARWAS